MAHVVRKQNVRGVRWQANYRGPDGRERTKTFTKKVLAEQWVRAQETARDRGEWLDPTAGQVTLADYSADYIDVKRATVAPRTFVNIEARWRNYIEPAFGARPIRTIRPAEVRRWTASLSASGLAPDTVRKVLQVLAQILRQAEVDRVIARSPIVGTELPRSSGGQEMHFLTATEVVRLADAITPLYRPMVFTAAYCGLRAGELEFLRVGSLDLLHGRLEVRGSLAEVHGEIIEGPTKTGNVRTVVPRFLASILSDHAR